MARSGICRVPYCRGSSAPTDGVIGIALLPAFLEARLPELRALTAPIDELQTPLWLITHPELKDTMRIRVLLLSLIHI